MKKKLIVDAGSTKTDWVLVNAENNTTSRCKSMGLNALIASDEQIISNFRHAAASLSDFLPQDEIFFYGAGCSTPEACLRIKNFLYTTFRTQHIVVDSDLVAAAISLLGNKPGIACILGTGSNSCYFDGIRITEHIPSLGYILGDEGSGTRLGIRFISDAYKGHLPIAIKQQFDEEFNLSMSEILEKVYRQPAPNKFLASIVPFIAAHIYNPYLYALVLQEFRLFIKRNILLYSNALSTTVNFTGSIAFHFANILRKACEEEDIKVGKITASPLDNLVDFYMHH